MKIINTTSTCKTNNFMFDGIVTPICVSPPCTIGNAESLDLILINADTFRLNCTSSVDLNNPTSTIPSINNGFTHGEIVLSIFGFLITAILLYKFYWDTIHKKIDKN